MSRTLDRLLAGVLSGKPTKFRSCDEADQETAHGVLPFIPIPLSQRQQQAILKAWSSDLSYIQGPPGTGKSHTISALMVSAVLLEKRCLLVSHKKAAIDVVRSKLESVLGDEFAIYVGADVAQRAATRARIQQLVSDVQTRGFRGRLKAVQDQVTAARSALTDTLRHLGQVERALGVALQRTNAVYQAHQEHLRARARYAESYGDIEVSANALASTPTVAMEWKDALEFLGDVHARRSAGDPVSLVEAFRARILLARYRRAFNAEWMVDTPWDVGRIQAHHRTLAPFDQARMEQGNIQIDLNRQRAQLADLKQRADEQANAYLRTLFRKIQMANAAGAVDDLNNFASLFRLRAPRLIKPLMARIDYSAITKVFPLWLGEMRDLGSVLPLQSGIFDLAVVDEASQVNIAEIVPTFYRAESFVVVGDRQQLGLEAAGLFAINRTFEELTWNNCFGGISGVIPYNEAKRREITVSTSSILDFIVNESSGISVPCTMLDEHFRSMPRLAAFTSDEFYRDAGGLKVMTEVGHNLGKDCFQLFEVGGSRAADGKYVQREVDKAIDLAKAIADGRELGNASPLRALGFRDPDAYPSVGIISFTTDQRDALRARGEEQIEDQLRRRVQFFVGTPEEFQGNERDVIILTFALGDGQRYAMSHYERPNRFNVATSRARKYTYAVIGQCPASAQLLRRYFGTFGFRPSAQQTINDAEPQKLVESPTLGARLQWRLDPRLCESEFEQLLLVCLQQFIDSHTTSRLRIFNQVKTCGQKRIDFVVYDEDSTRSVAIEVDGPAHFCADGRTYHQEHLERVSVLQRAGWKVVHVPYYKWYQHGWLYDRKDPDFSRHLDEFNASLRGALGLQSERSKRRTTSFLA